MALPLVVQLEEEPQVQPVNAPPQQPVQQQPIEEEIEVQPVDQPPPEAVKPAGAGAGGEEEEEEEEQEEEEPQPPPIFQRERLRFLVGNAPQKRRWNISGSGSG